MTLYAVPLTGGGVGYGGFFALGIGVIAGSGDGDCAGGRGLIGFPFGSVSTITGWRIGLVLAWVMRSGAIAIK